MNMSSYLTVRMVEALEKAAEAAKTAAEAYARKVEKETQPEMKANVQGPKDVSVRWPDGVGYQ